MTWFRVGGAGIPASLKNAMNAVFNKKFGTSGQNYPPKQWPDDVNLLGPLPEGTATGPIANFSDGADDVPVKSCVATIAPTLSGVSTVSETQTGRNLFDKNATPFQTSKYIVSTTIIGSSDFTYSGNANYNVYRISVLPNTTYTMSKIKANAPSWGLMDTNGLVTSVTQNNGGTDGVDVTFTTGANDVYLFVSVGISGTYKCDDILQIEYGSTAHAYEQYQTPTQYTASLGRTIYGGEVDIVNGTGQDYALWVNLSDIAWTEDANRTGVFYGSVSGRKSATADEPSDVLGCTCYDVNNVNVTTSIDNYISGARSYGGNIIFFRDSSFHGYTRAQVQEALQGEKVCVVSANPTDFTFDGQEINSLYGVNNFWNDAGGDTTVVYRRDIDLALQAVSSSRGLMMASRPVTQLVGEESDPDQVNELVENDETEQEGEDNAR